MTFLKRLMLLLIQTVYIKNEKKTLDIKLTHFVKWIFNLKCNKMFKMCLLQGNRIVLKILEF